MGRHRLATLTLTLTCLLCGPALGQGLSLEETFERTAALHGKSYAVGRDFLLSRGGEIAALVEKKLLSENWKERRLARVLENAAEGNDAILLVDRLWEDFRGLSGHDEKLWSEALPVLAKHGDVETARAVLHMLEYGALRQFNDAILEMLVAIGEPVTPALREAMGYPHWAPIPTAAAMGKLGGDGNRAFLEEALPNVISGKHAEAICAALAEIGDPRSLPVLLTCLVRSANTGRRSSGSWKHVDYGRVRSALLHYGRKAIPFLRQAAAKDAPMPGRFLASGILCETENPEGSPGTVPLIAEQAARGDLEALARLSVCEERDLAFDVTANVITRRVAYVNPHHDRLLTRLGELDGERAVAFYEALPKEHRLHYSANAVIRGILFANHPSGIPLLDEIEQVARDRDASEAALASAVREVLTGGTHRLFDLLGHPGISVREAAALTILGAGDSRAIPALVKVAAERRDGQTGFIVKKLLAHGRSLQQRSRSVAPVYRKLASGAADPLVRLLAEEMHTRLEFPKLARTFDEAMSPPPWRMHLPPGLDYYRRIGHAVAEKVGPGAVPLLESTVVFHGGQGEILFAAFALSKLAQERSIPILLAAAKERRIGGAALGAALREFGPAGIEAAKGIPTADPEGRGFRGRRGRHAGATEALVAEDDPEGAEKILAGLTNTPPEDRSAKRVWESVCRRYLGLAARYDDPRLLMAALAFVGKYGDGYLHAALPVLMRHDDPRVEPHLLRTLRFTSDRERSEGLIAIRQRFGDGTVEKLLELLRTSRDGAMRCGAAWGLGVIASAGQKEEVAAPAREQVIPPLLKALKNGDAHLKRAAADALAMVIWNKYSRRTLADRRPVKPLAEWLGKEYRDYHGVLRVFTESRDPEATELLLEVYGRRETYREWMADALATLGRKEVIPDLVEMKRLHSLAKLGKAGLSEVHRFVGGKETLGLQALALDILRKHNHRIPFEEVEVRFRELMANVGWDPLLSRPDDRRMQEMSYGFSSFAQGLAWLDREQAYPLVKLAMLETRHGSVRGGLGIVLSDMEHAQPELASVQPPARVTRWPVEPAEIRFLKLCDLFRDAVEFGRKQSNPPFPEEQVAKLAAGGKAAAEAAIELCYPQGGLATAEDVAREVRQLADPALRNAAVHRLALGIYANRHLDSALAASEGDALRYGLAIRQWRRMNDPWFLMHRRRLLGIAMNLLANRLPVKTVRDYALENFERLAKIDRRLETFLYYEPLAPVLASIRMSESPGERARLGEFLTIADPVACLTGYYVTIRALQEGTARWGTLPAHDYPAEVLGGAALKIGKFLKSKIHYERMALEFVLMYTPRWSGFDVLEVLRDQHPDEAVRKVAEGLRRRRR